MAIIRFGPIHAPEARTDAWVRNRHTGGSGRMLDACQRGHTRQRVKIELVTVAAVVSSRRQLHGGCEYVFRLEAEIYALKFLKAAQQQTGSGQQHERERHLADDKGVQCA